jgi:hypothetical protein
VLSIPRKKSTLLKNHSKIYTVIILIETGIYLDLKKKKREREKPGRLTPIILVTQEAQIRRITVQSQARQIVHDTLS